MILVDTSVWIDHLRRHDGHLAALLERNDVAMHQMVLGELALGSLARRSEVLALLGNLSTITRVDDDEVLVFIERQKLWSRGLGLVDAHLLAAARVTPGTTLWTRDARLRSAASDFDFAYAGGSAPHS